jgi:hypothetical protein
MKKQEWNEALNHLDPEIVEKYVLQKDELRQKKRKKTVWFRAVIIAACLAVVVGVIAVMLMPKENDDNIIPTPNGSDGLNIINPQAPSLEPLYYGSEYSNSTSMFGEVATYGFSLTVEFVEALPDTYTLFQDWEQREYKLLKMRTVKMFIGEKMFEEFYYMMPIEFMTDFSLYDRFIIIDMSQSSYEYSVMYNKTQGKAEQLNLARFESNLGENFMAFYKNGKFAEELWQSNDAWKKETEYGVSVATLKEGERELAKMSNEFGYSIYAHSLSGVSGEAAETLEYIKSFENGIFAPISSRVHALSPEVQFHATRYINGFATNERVSVWDKEWKGGDEYSYEFSKAHFSEEDLKALPDLRAAITTVADAYDKGEIHPPHIKNYEELSIRDHGIFGWYAKTDDGVIGIVRVSFCYSGKGVDGLRLDDAYYIIEYGSNTCKPIDRDALLERLGECESTYIYTGEYNEKGKDMVLYG